LPQVIVVAGRSAFLKSTDILHIIILTSICPTSTSTLRQSLVVWAINEGRDVAAKTHTYLLNKAAREESL